VRSLAAWSERAQTILAVCDSFGELDLRPLGIVHCARSPWLARPPTPLRLGPEAPAVAGLDVTQVTSATDLVAFERTVVRSFGARPPISDLDIHAPGILADPSMVVLLGRLDGAPAGVAMGYRAAGVLGIYGVGVVPEARGRGVATVLTLAVLSEARGVVATLQTTPAAESLYRRLGFSRVGWYDHWV
jgi:ribosomal protein S18 acetylase RimI-like enzyme